MASLRLRTAIVAAKATMRLSRMLGIGGGTAAPGLVAAFFEPAVLTRLVTALPRGSVIVTGTNGKTMIARMLSGLLARSGFHPVHNREGSNLLRGVITALIAQSDRTGRSAGDIGLWEVDEAALRIVMPEVKPKVIIMNNLFRDQLDRYGEVDSVRRGWAESLSVLPSSTTAILNADDPGVACLGRDLKNRVWYYGLEDPAMRLSQPVQTSDVRTCPFCRSRLEYELHFISHLGHYECRNCGWRRPSPDFRARAISLDDARAVSCTIETPDGAFKVTMQVPGVYNVYNALAAVAVATACGATRGQCAEGLAQVRAAFGRGEWLTVLGKQVGLFLIKNPTGASEVLRMLTWNKHQLKLMIAINDLIADGRDVSWLWDANFEMLAGCVNQVTVSGIRAQDMALRLKYAGIDPKMLKVENDIGQALRSAVHALGTDETLFVLPTYTALLEMQRLLSRWGCRSSYWQE
jgi:UDP-N-acetylmuramyl tripeptide synthase